MQTPPSRRLPADSVFFRDAAEVPLQTSASVEGRSVVGLGELKLRSLITGPSMVVIEAFRKKGLIDPPHRHLDHDSIAYLISGRMKVVIDGKEFVATAGSVWHHPRGVEHSSEALEDSHQIEVKSPATQTWTVQDV